VLDVTNPSPSIGWANRERGTLQDRGKADLVLALALIHHIAIGNNVPLRKIVSFLATLGRAAIIEWVPKDDVKVRQLLRDREDVFDGYTRRCFEDAVGAVGEIVAQEPVEGTGRELYMIEMYG
jgi:hypothetical protein